MKKGNLNTVSGLIISLVAIAIVLAVGLLIQSQAQDQIVSIEGIDEGNTSTFTTAYNASINLQNSTYDITDWLPLIVLVTIGAALLVLVMMFKS